MAVPKKKTSKSRRNNRRSHDALSRVNISYNKETGEASLSHHVSLDGYYGDKQIIKEKTKEEDKSEQQDQAPAEKTAK